ncbi:hypothetical protein SPHINGOR109_11148 [Sphingorhabdus sp. 109]|nr:hypothetical protein SPHINGOR109_11148 [Sphingorhabdus sp. 109]
MVFGTSSKSLSTSCHLFGHGNRLYEFVGKRIPASHSFSTFLHCMMLDFFGALNDLPINASGELQFGQGAKSSRGSILKLVRQLKQACATK